MPGSRGDPRHPECEDDRRLRLELTEPAHRHVLRDTLERHGTLTLLEAPNPTAFGWLDGRAHELVLPLASTQAPGHAPRPRRRSDRPTTVEHGHLPGASPWLSATIVAHPDRHSTILTAHLPDLLSTWDSEPEWWFIRHHDPEHHLRLRIRIPAADGFGAAAQRVGDWSRRLRQRGLVGQLRLETYDPETGVSAALAGISPRVTSELRAARAGMQPWQAPPAVRTLDEQLAACGLVPERQRPVD